MNAKRGQGAFFCRGTQEAENPVITRSPLDSRLGIQVPGTCRYKPNWGRMLQKSCAQIAVAVASTCQFVVVSVFFHEGIENLNLSNPWLIDQNRIRKVNRDSGMFGTSRHQLESKIHRWTNANDHDTATTPC